MRWRFLPFLVLLFLLCTEGSRRRIYRKKPPPKKPDKILLDKKQQALARHLLHLQFYVEEISRSNGASGLKVMRLRNEGTRPYHASTYADDFTCSSTHDHADFFNTCGMGEIVFVLNGVEAKSRHNDFLLVRKSTKSKKFGETENIPYPGVPPSVTSCGSLKSQIAELKEYFRAWYKQDISIRDYRPYFKANFCYMEAAWTDYPPDTLQEAFFSERHWYAADSWNDLFQKTRFASYTGIKENLENHAYMPRTLWNVTDEGECIFGQWNYKILCHPLKDDLPLNRLRAVDDLKSRMSNLVTFDQYVNNRNARFQVNPINADRWFDGPTKHGLLDDMFAQVPGLDNEGAVLHDDSFGNTIRDFTAVPGDPILNTAYFHRWFQNDDLGAMGVKIRHRGFNDPNMWVAMNTQKNILPISLKHCYEDNGKTKCSTWTQRWSYAIPMEIIYTTPLNSWNPYNIEFKGLETTPRGLTVYEGPKGTRRNGRNDPDKAYNGTNTAVYYLTPYEFYEGGELGVDPADTPKNFVHVLDSSGKVRRVRASGIRTFLPKIAGLPKLRTRYMIPSIYTEGNAISKELEALEDIVLNPDRFKFMLRNDPRGVVFPIKVTLQAGSAGHSHGVLLLEQHQLALSQTGKTSVVTEWANGHTHNLEIARSATGVITYTKCSNLPQCPDGHPSTLA